MKMSYAVFLIWFIFATLYKISETSKIEEIHFLKNFVQTQNYTTQIISYLCWSRDDLIKLSTEFSKAYFSYNILEGHTIFNSYLSKERKLFVIDSSCMNFETVVQQALIHNLLRAPYVWVIFWSSTLEPNKNYNFAINSLIFSVQKCDHDMFKVTSPYKINKNFTGYLEHNIALWTVKTRRFLYFNELSIFKNRTNFMKENITLSYVILTNETMEHLTDYRHNPTDKPAIICYKFLPHLIDSLNATQQKLFRKGRGITADGNFVSGLMGDVQQGRADLSGTAVFISSERSKVFQFLMDPLPENIVVFFRAPPLSYTSNVFKLTFSKGVWYCTVIIFVIFCIMVYVILNWESKHYDTDQQDVEIDYSNFVTVLLMQISIVAQMDSYLLPRSISGMIIQLVCLLSFMCLYTLYSARIIILLQSPSEYIKDFQTMYDTHIDFGVQDAPYNRFYYSTPNDRSNEKWRKILYEEKIAPNGKSTTTFLPPEQGMKLVRDKFFAYNVELTTGYQFIEKFFFDDQKCSIRYIDPVYKISNVYLFVRVNSSYADFFAVGLKRLFEYGLHDRERKMIFTKKPVCHGTEDSFVSVGLIDVQFVFFLFTAGILLSLLVLFFEIIVHSYNKKRNRVHV